ncbi:MAG: class II fructose-bisphosphate aldolase [Bacilli bacterium]|nr:class II fructose-bisphosphate aldolase [Bacilli bacterium]
MLVNSKEILKEFKRNNKAVIHFNINNLEWTKWILEECNRLNVPVILGCSESAVKYMGGFDVVYSIVTSLIKDLDIKIDVVLHLDHGHSVESCTKAIDAGFTSVMIDASCEDFNQNVLITKEVVNYAHSKNVTVEAEIGIMGQLNHDNVNFGSTTNVSDVLEFVKQTGVDSIAPAVGTVHGMYRGDLKIDYDLIHEISMKVDIPLVLHGGSGLSNEILKKCVKNGITKININSDLQDKWSLGVREYLANNNEVIDPRKIISSGMDKIKSEIDLKLNIND